MTSPQTPTDAGSAPSAAPPEKVHDVLCLGEPMLEFSEETEGRYLRGFGGDTSNVAIAVARAGARAAYATRLGDDPFGEMVLALWAGDGVDATAVIRDPSAPTAHYFVHQGKGGHTFTYARKGSAASLMRPGDLSRRAVETARVLHLSGITCAISAGARALAEEAVDMARACGTRVSFDLNYRPALSTPDEARAVALTMFSKADVALPSLEEAELVFGLTRPEAILDKVLSLGPKVVALTMGAGGAWVATPEGRWRIGPVQVRPVDASGAGDTFDGYFLSGLTAGDDLVLAATRANAAAAMSTTRRGAVAGIPYAAEVVV